MLEYLALPECKAASTAGGDGSWVAAFRRLLPRPASLPAAAESRAAPCRCCCHSTTAGGGHRVWRHLHLQRHRAHHPHAGAGAACRPACPLLAVSDAAGRCLCSSRRRGVRGSRMQAQAGAQPMRGAACPPCSCAAEPAALHHGAAAGGLPQARPRLHRDGHPHPVREGVSPPCLLIRPIGWLTGGAALGPPVAAPAPPRQPATAAAPMGANRPPSHPAPLRRPPQLRAPRREQPDQPLPLPGGRLVRLCADHPPRGCARLTGRPAGSRARRHRRQPAAQPPCRASPRHGARAACPVSSNFPFPAPCPHTCVTILAACTPANPQNTPTQSTSSRRACCSSASWRCRTESCTTSWCCRSRG